MKFLCEMQLLWFFQKHMQKFELFVLEKQNIFCNQSVGVLLKNKSKSKKIYHY